MPDGKEMGRAYVTVNLDDHTDADYARLKSNLESKGDITLGTKLKAPDAGDYDKIKALTEAKGDISLKTKLDTTDAQKSFRDLESTIDTSSKKSSSSIGQFVTSTAGAWTALGAVLAGPAVALSLGVVAGGFAAIGIEAEKSQPQVTSAVANMKTTGTDVLQSSFASLTPFIAGSVNTWTSSIRTLAPSFAGISGEIGPGMRIISQAIADAAQRDIPAMSAALSQATPMAHALAGGIGDVSNGFAQFLGVLDFNAADAGMATLLRDVGQLEPTLAAVLNAVMPLGNALLSTVVPAVLTLVSDLSNGLAPALGVVGSAVTALAPAFNFLSGPNDAILVSVLGYKALGGAVSAVLPVFNTASNAVSTYSNKLLEMTGTTDKSVGSFNLMTDAQKKAAVQAAASGLASATEAAATAQANLATLESAAAADAASVSQEQLAAARVAATVAAEAETAATEAVNAASESTSFALGPVGIGLGVVAGLMTLFGGNTDKATPPVQNFSAELDKLAAAAPGAAKGILASDPALASLINRATSAGVSFDALVDAFDQGGSAATKVQDALNGTVASLGNQTTAVQAAAGAGKAGGEAAAQQTMTIKALSDAVGSSGAAFDALTPAQQQAVRKYQDVSSALTDLTANFEQNADTQKAAGAVGGQAVQLTADQQTAATSVAKMYGLSVSSVVAAFQVLPGAGSTAAGAVSQVSSAFMSSENAALNAVQSTKDYFSQLAQNAEQANNALSNANHSYEQSVQSVSDAEHGAAQAAQAVTDASAGVVTARRAVTDATNSAAQSERAYEASQRAVADAEAGVTAAEKTLAQAQVSETQAQKALTDARAAAVEQLKSMQLQLADQQASEERAKIKLFDATNTASALHITPSNTADILAAPLTASNEAQKQSALDLVDAENALADTLNTGDNLRKQVTAANLAGVNGNAQVVSATQAVANAQDQVNAANVGVTKAHQAVSDAVNAEQQALYNLGKAQQAIVDAQTGVVKAQKAVSDAVYNEQKARDAVKDAIYSERQALLAVNEAQAAAKKANDLNTTSLDQTTQAGRNNWAQLQTIFTSIPAWVTGNDRYRQMVNDTATAFGGSKQAAYDFLQQQNAIPKTFTYAMTAVADVDSSSWAAAVSSTANTQGQAAKLNMLSHMADGGLAKGPGGPRSDVIPAMLSNNEYVQPADVVEHYGVGYMDALRQKKVPRGGDGASLPGFASGGLVGAASDVAALGIEGAAYQINVDALTSLGLPHPNALPAYVPPPPSSGGDLHYAGNAGVNQWTPQVLQALGMLGQPASLLPNVLRRMNQESGGNPDIVNKWDSNWLKGTPSVGLMQVIGPTFRSNAGPFGGTGPFEYGVSVDPEANIYSGLHYAMNRYPSLQYAMDKPGGYDSGGYMLNKPALNSTGKPEMVLDPGMTDTMQKLNAAVQSSSGGSSTKAPTVIHNHTWNITSSELSAEKVANQIFNEMAWQLRNG